MDRPLKEFVRIISKTLKTSEPIYEFGSRQMKGQEVFADLRSIFANKKDTAKLKSPLVCGKFWTCTNLPAHLPVLFAP